MDNSCNCSFDLRIIRSRNVNIRSGGDFFIRCHLPVGGGNKRVKLDSKQVSSKSNLAWNQTISLQCSATQDSIRWLEDRAVLFELRRTSSSVMSRIASGGSKLVARAEVQWKDLVSSKKMDAEKWVVMTPQSRYEYDNVKPPAVQVAMRVRDGSSQATERRGGSIEDEWCCGDSRCNSCTAYEVFALGVALEAF